MCVARQTGTMADESLAEHYQVLEELGRKSCQFGFHDAIAPLLDTDENPSRR